jgi:hypothetical protein
MWPGDLAALEAYERYRSTPEGRTEELFGFVENYADEISPAEWERRLKAYAAERVQPIQEQVASTFPCAGKMSAPQNPFKTVDQRRTAKEKAVKLYGKTVEDFAIEVLHTNTTALSRWVTDRLARNKGEHDPTRCRIEAGISKILGITQIGH